MSQEFKKGEFSWKNVNRFYYKFLRSKNWLFLLFQIWIDFHFNIVQIILTFSTEKSSGFWWLPVLSQNRCWNAVPNSNVKTKKVIGCGEKEKRGNILWNWYSEDLCSKRMPIQHNRVCHFKVNVNGRSLEINSRNQVHKVESKFPIEF